MSSDTPDTVLVKTPFTDVCRLANAWPGCDPPKAPAPSGVFSKWLMAATTLSYAGFTTVRTTASMSSGETLTVRPVVPPPPAIHDVVHVLHPPASRRLVLITRRWATRSTP